MARCGQCAYLDLTEEYNGEYPCSERSGYHSTSEAACWSFKAREDGGGCYLTTIVCNILGYADNGNILNTLRQFRDNVMRNNNAYQYLLNEYDVVGPKIAACIEHDAAKQELALLMKERYILPVYEYLQQKNYAAAVSQYKEMVLYLKQHYASELSVAQNLMVGCSFNWASFLYKEQLENAM